MPVGGAKPKPPGQKRTRVKPVHDWVEVPSVPYDGPVPMAADVRWSSATKRWWKVIRRMPHCALWGEEDWWFAYRTAELWSRWDETHDTKFLAELRQRERQMGTTLDSRRDIRVRYVDPDEGGEIADVSAMADYRKLLEG